MKIHKVNPLKGEKERLDNLDELKKMIKDCFVKSDEYFVCNEDLLNYLKSKFKYIYQVDVWNLMRDNGFKRGQRRILGKVTRGYYLKFK